MHVNFHKITPYTWKSSEFYLCFHNSCEIWHSFSQTPMRNFLSWFFSSRNVFYHLVYSQISRGTSDPLRTVEIRLDFLFISSKCSPCHIPIWKWVHILYYNSHGINGRGMIHLFICITISLDGMADDTTEMIRLSKNGQSKETLLTKMPES